MNGEHELDGTLAAWLHELSHQVDELAQLLAGWPAPDEPSIVQTVREQADRLRDELADARAALVVHADSLQSEPSPEQTGDESPAEIGPSEPGAPPRGSTDAENLNERSAATRQPSHVFRIPGHPDIPVTDEEWNAIERLLGSRSRTDEAA